jgi:propanediol utilization protein
MTDGLKLTNIGIKNVIRKTNRSDSKPGIVVISFENLVQKKSVLKEKRLLKNSSKYSNVFIENILYTDFFCFKINN